MTPFPFHVQISGLAQGEQARKVHVDVMCSWMQDFGPIMVDSQVLRQFQRRNSTDFLVGTIFFPPEPLSLPPAGLEVVNKFVPSRRCADKVVGCLGGDFCLQLERFQSIGILRRNGRSIHACLEGEIDVVSLFVFFLTDLRLEEFHVFFLIIFVV